MRLCILARKKKIYSNIRFREESTALGVEIVMADPNEYEIVLGRKSPLLCQGGKVVQPMDMVMSRMGASITTYGLSVLSQFEMMGVPTLNSVTSILRSRNKLRCIQHMSRYDIDIPRTIVVRKPSDIDSSIEKVGGYPVVLKLISGSQGVGVMLVQDRETIESTLGTLWSLGQDILLQECIQESLGRDIRAIVVGGHVVAAMRRQARIGEFRSNIHQGGVATSVTLDLDYERAAKRAAKIVGLDVAGVDILESHEGPKIIEVNSSPGLQGIEHATGVNVARKILEHGLELKNPSRSTQQVSAYGG